MVAVVAELEVVAVAGQLEVAVTGDRLEVAVAGFGGFLEFALGLARLAGGDVEETESDWCYLARSLLVCEQVRDFLVLLIVGYNIAIAVVFELYFFYISSVVPKL